MWVLQRCNQSGKHAAVQYTAPTAAPLRVGAAQGMGTLRGWYQDALGLTSESGGSSGALSSGGIAGAVVGSVVGAALLVAVAVLWALHQVHGCVIIR